MKFPLYQVDAFTGQLFSGNPAAVVLSESELAPEIMQSIAAENNLSETAFVVTTGENYQIRWFTPTIEVNLCGHATLHPHMFYLIISAIREAPYLFHQRAAHCLFEKK